MKISKANATKIAKMFFSPMGLPEIFYSNTEDNEKLNLPGRINIQWSAEATILFGNMVDSRSLQARSENIEQLLNIKLGTMWVGFFDQKFTIWAVCKEV